MSMLAGKTVTHAMILTYISCKVKEKGPKEKLLTAVLSSVLNHMALEIIVRKRMDTQQEHLCTRVKRLGLGRTATDSQMCSSYNVAWLLAT